MAAMRFFGHQKRTAQNPYPVSVRSDQTTFQVIQFPSLNWIVCWSTTVCLPRMKKHLNHTNPSKDACVYPDIMFRLRQSYNPVQTICFSEAMRGPSVFQATVMVISAAHLSSLRGFREQEMNSKAIQHKVKAIHMLNHGVRTITTETAVGILFGIVSLALAEVRCQSLS